MNSLSQYNPYNSNGVGSSNYGIGLGTSSTPSASFMESNGAIANVTFLIIVVFAFIILLRVGVAILVYFMQTDSSPRLINGMVKGNQLLTIYQDPSSNDAITIYRSSNENEGIEFTWSVWIFINDIIANSDNTFKHVFSKGNLTVGENGMMEPNNAPGVYLAPNRNALVVVMNTYRVINEEVIIPNIPINKWMNVIIRCQNTTMDVYINGTISRSINLTGIPKQNYGNVYVGANGGFDGYVSNLWYYNYALGTSAIQRLVEKGPDTTINGTSLNDKSSDYLSLRWYFFGAGNGFNPDLPSV